jgi:hypothetical protein
MIRSVFMPMSPPVQFAQVRRQVSSVVMPRTGQNIQPSVARTITPPVMILGLL